VAPRLRIAGPDGLPGPDDRLGGWGLHLVAQLADDWGHATDEQGTLVWMIRRAPPVAG
jgi:hypothetical protein